MSGSMTGWGIYKTPELNIAIRGLNSKYKEIYLHLPQDLIEAEPLIYKILNDRITRGRVDMYLNFNIEKIKRKYIINNYLFNDAYKKIQNMFKKLNIKQDLPIEYILRDVEGVATTQVMYGYNKLSFEKIKKAVILAIDDFEKSKKAEGTRLIKNIRENILKIEKISKKIKIQFLNFRDVYTEKTRKKIEEIFKSDTDKNIINKDVVEIIEKYDVTEELVRLESHIKQLLMITKLDVSGKKIDFFTQEIFREVNTISSKIQDVNIAGLVIQIKELTEKIREQAQNLE